MSFTPTNLAFAALLFSFNMWTQTPPEANKLVTLNKIETHGSRLQEEALVQLSGLAVGQQVNDLIVNKACHKITSTGLIKKIDYGYDVYPDKPGVTLVLTLMDEKPLLPAKITPAADEEQLWQAAARANPLLTRDLPRTEAALKFYAVEMEAVLKKIGREDEYVAPLVTADSSGSASEIVFSVRRYKETKSVAK